MVSFNSQEIKFNLKNKILLKKWIVSTIEKKKKKAGDISFVFCSDAFLLNINKQFLNHDTLTDIITFDYTKEKISGEIYISIDRVKENAKIFSPKGLRQSKSFEAELNRVIIHGVLHLLGHRDKTKSAKIEMTKEEEASLKLLKKLK